MNALAPPIPPIDITKPNAHDSKAEFQYEQKAVKACVENLRATVHLLAPDKVIPDQGILVDRLRPVIDQKLRSQASRSEIEDARSLALKNVAETGGYNTSLFVLLELWTALEARQQELIDQEEKFWNINHRAPDYYARVIAIRLAKLFAKEVGQRPGYGTAAITGDPSTSYSRALKKTFKLLKIKAGVRTHGEYAVAQVTDDDLKPLVNSLAQMMESGRTSNRPMGLIGGLLGSLGESTKS
ncbi:hypothetical protein [Roseovarius sp. MMSF_3359]|nr:hypothetical protein [Roseovarius sp. MMSF_3359]